MGTAGLHPGRPQPHALTMFRWLLVVFFALLLIDWFSPLLQRFGFGRLPGDLRFRLFGRLWFIPITTTLVLSLVAGLVSKFI